MKRRWIISTIPYKNRIILLSETRYEDEPYILDTEVKDAIKHISSRKSSGCDGIPIELLKAGGDSSINILLILFNSILRTKEWPKDWKKSDYLPIYKKECGNYITIDLTSHASKIFFLFIQKILEHIIIPRHPI